MLQVMGLAVPRTRKVPTPITVQLQFHDALTLPLKLASHLVEKALLIMTECRALLVNPSALIILTDRSVASLS